MEHTEEKELHACCKSNATDAEACTDCTEEKTEEKCCGCHKTKHRSDEEYKKLIHRLNRIEGQIRGIRGMLERDAYCADILTQSAAVSAAMNGFNRALLNAHLHNCVVRDIRAGDDSVVDELTELLQKLMK